MKTYPPRVHDKKKRTNRKDWPKYIAHEVDWPKKPYRDRKGWVTILRPE